MTNEREVFDVATEDGRLFCRCMDTDKGIVLIGKQGSLDLELFLRQVLNPTVARQIRGKKNNKAQNAG